MSTVQPQPPLDSHPPAAPWLEPAVAALTALARGLVPGCGEATLELVGEARWHGLADRTLTPLGTDVAADTFSLPLLSKPVEEGGELLGLLTLHACGRPFGPEAAAPARLVASMAAALVAGWEACGRREDQLREALRSRDVIGQAKGVLMAQSGVDADEAFRLLVRASQRENRKLRAVAAQVAARARRPIDTECAR